MVRPVASEDEMTELTEKARADAHAILRAQYWAHVRRLAEDCHRAVVRGQVATREDLRRYAEELVDSSSAGIGPLMSLEDNDAEDC